MISLQFGNGIISLVNSGLLTNLCPNCRKSFNVISRCQISKSSCWLFCLGMKPPRPSQHGPKSYPSTFAFLQRGECVFSCTRCWYNILKMQYTNGLINIYFDNSKLYFQSYIYLGFLYYLILQWEISQLNMGFCVINSLSLPTFHYSLNHFFLPALMLFLVTFPFYRLFFLLPFTQKNPSQHSICVLCWIITPWFYGFKCYPGIIFWLVDCFFAV